MSGTVHIRTYGCQMNVRDSDAAAALLELRGFRVVEEESEADVILVNTCSVREKAEDKALGKLALLVATKRRRPDRLVGAIGCMVQRLGTELIRRVPGLDFALGPHREARLPDVIEAVRAGSGPVVDVAEVRVEPDGLPLHRAGTPLAFVNILYGCNRRCAYCIVPAVRGREWSRPAASILDELRGLAQAGAQDVTLLGQSVMSYGRTNPVWPSDAPAGGRFREPLPRLMEAAGALGIPRLRFTSGHPAGCTDELIRVMADTPALCEHLHLPLQSGSDSVLARMRRGYDVATYRRAVTALREAMPGFALTTDIIVGFPGETESDFEKTRQVFNEIRFDNAFIFKYSPRAGTPAAAWPDDVSDADKRRRNRLLLDDQDRIGLALHEPLIGRDLEVLAEGPSLRNAGRWSGRTRTNKIVIFENPGTVRAGDRVQVRIGRVMPQTLYGALTP